MLVFDVSPTQFSMSVYNSFLGLAWRKFYTYYVHVWIDYLNCKLKLQGKKI